MPATTDPAADRGRHLLFLATPALWPSWPFLPVVRRTARGAEYGLLFDPAAAGQPSGRRFAVYRGNLFLLPATLAEFLASEHETYDSAEAVYVDHWRVD